MTENVKRLSIIEKIINLRARAEDDASSEAEVVAALHHAEKMMNAYNIEEAELALALTEGKVVIEIVTKGGDSMFKNGGASKGHRHKSVLAYAGIEHFTDTKCVMYQRTGKVVWTGHKPDVEMAIYLAGLIRHAIDAEWATYVRANPQRGYGAKASFETSMALRVSNRLQDMARARNAENKRAAAAAIEHDKTASSTALVIVEAREEKIRQRDTTFRAAFPKLGTARSFGAVNNGSAFSAGRAAGDRVNLGRAINNSAPVARLGR